MITNQVAANDPQIGPRALSAFTVTARTHAGQVTFPAVGTDSGAVHLAALDQFGVCGVTVKPAKAL